MIAIIDSMASEYLPNYQTALLTLEQFHYIYQPALLTLEQFHYIYQPARIHC
jgi:hypothetical protein